MTKKEIVNKLITEYGVKKKDLMKKTVKELEEILENEKERASVGKAGAKEVEPEPSLKENNEVLEDKEEKVSVNKVNKAEAKEIESESSFEEVAEKNSKALEKTLEDDKEEVISEVQLSIYETIVRRFDPSRNLRIENLGAGDVFVSEEKENLIQEKNKIAPGQEEYIPNASVLYITSASRPIIRIIY